MLIIASCLLIFIGAIHSILGEKYILIRLLKRDDRPNFLAAIGSLNVRYGLRGI